MEAFIKLKILIISDFHDRKIEDKVPVEILKSVDFVISAGDYGYFYPPNSIGVYGNHELMEEVNQKNTLNNVHFKIVGYKGFTFTGIMGVFCGEKRYTNPNRKRWYHQLQSIVDDYLDKTPTVDFFITHERAYGIFDLVRNKHAGNQGYRKYIDEKQPSFYISGHVNSNEKTNIVGSTICINPHSQEWDYVTLELPSKRIRFMKGDKEV